MLERVQNYGMLSKAPRTHNKLRQELDWMTIFRKEKKASWMKLMHTCVSPML